MYTGNMAPDIDKFSSQGEGPVTLSPTSRPADGAVTMHLDAIFDASASLQRSLNQPRLLHFHYHGNQSLELCGVLPGRTLVFARWSFLG